MTDKNKTAGSDHVVKNSLWRSRIKLIGIFSLFLGPLAVAFFWYYGLGAAWLPQGQSNHAALINPVVALTPFENSRFDHGRISPERISLESLKHKWTIVHLLSSDCQAQCQKSLYNTRQARLALGKDANRVQRYVVVNDAVPANAIQQRRADAVLVNPSASSSPGLQKQLQRIIEQHNIGNHDALLVDPVGNVMMVIPVNLDPRLLLKDLKKLLKVSRIG
ncbi:hypothetical protein [Candidatus Spongiihabitans sp.]|uniref:hypothetical protein n=1 Tax=Candidatus Spongiihabitans sp. TaxID=3101308 RepID=UPI003C7C17C3